MSGPRLLSLLAAPPPAVSGRPLLVAYSGGLDSTVLLHALAATPSARAAGLRAIHVHHGLHAEADRWTEHCRRTCAAWQVELVVASVQVDRTSGQGLEAAAREARYAAFAGHLREDETLALAHHRDDQAETVLQRLLRAAGSQGLSAMRALRPFAGGWLWRPLLALPRSELRDYADAQRMEWIEDPTNADLVHERNFLRLRILPALAERWPQATAALARSADLLAEDAALLRTETDRRLAQVQGLDPQTLSVPALLALPAAWHARVLRAWLESLGLPPLPGHAFPIIAAELLAARRDAEPEFRWAGAVMQRWRDLLHAGPARAPLPDDWQCDWSGEKPLALPGGDRLAFIPVHVGAAPAATSAVASPGQVPAGAAPTDEGLAPFRLRARRGGERIHLSGRDHSHALKHVLQELGVPPWWRERLPLLFAADGELLAAGDLAVSGRLLAQCGGAGLRLVWQLERDSGAR